MHLQLLTWLSYKNSIKHTSHVSLLIPGTRIFSEISERSKWSMSAFRSRSGKRPHSNPTNLQERFISCSCHTVTGFSSRSLPYLHSNLQTKGSFPECVLCKTSWKGNRRPPASTFCLKPSSSYPWHISYISLAKTSPISKADISRT